MENKDLIKKKGKSFLKVRNLAPIVTKRYNNDGFSFYCIVC